MPAEHVQLMPSPDDLPHNIEGRHAGRTGAGRGGPARDRRGRAADATIGRAEAMTTDESIPMGLSHVYWPGGNRKSHALYLWRRHEFGSPCGLTLKDGDIPPDHLRPIGKDGITCERCRKAIGKTMGFTAATNNRRAELILRDIFDEDLSEPEKAELARLQDLADRFVELVAPRPLDNLEELEAHIEELRRGAEARKSPTTMEC
jgi:hypothetical protein